MESHWRVPPGLHAVSVRLSDEGELPSLDGATGWLNSAQLTPTGAQAYAFTFG
jgi:hypothetical protein